MIADKFVHMVPPMVLYIATQMNNCDPSIAVTTSVEIHTPRELQCSSYSGYRSSFPITTEVVRNILLINFISPCPQKSGHRIVAAVKFGCEVPLLLCCVNCLLLT